MVRATKPPFSPPVVTEQPFESGPPTKHASDSESPTSPLHRNAPPHDETARASASDPEAPPMGPPDASDAKSGCVIN